MSSEDEAVTLSMLSAASSKVVLDVVPDGGQTPPLEVVFDRVTLDPGTVDNSLSYRMLELWTERRQYVIDTTFTCIEVVDRKTRQSDHLHHLLHARLIGGQRRYGKTVHQIKPFPIVGTGAVFEPRATGGQQKPIQTTSKVMRVVLHVRVSSIVLDPNAAFDDVTNANLLPYDKR